MSKNKQKYKIDVGNSIELSITVKTNFKTVNNCRQCNQYVAPVAEVAPIVQSTTNYTKDSSKVDYSKCNRDSKYALFGHGCTCGMRGCSECTYANRGV